MQINDNQNTYFIYVHSTSERVTVTVEKELPKMAKMARTIEALRTAAASIK